MALPTVSDVNGQVRSILADSTPDVFTDAILLPYIQRAYRKAARVLRAAGMKLLVKDSSAIVVTAAVTHLDRSGAGTLYPADLIRPILLRERPSAPPGSAWSQMSQNPDEPIYDATAGTKRRVWYWLSDSIYFPAASASTDVVIRYEAELPALSGNSSEILILDGMDAVALLAAAYAAQSRDEQAMSAKFTEMGMEDLQLLAQSEVGIKRARAATFGGQ